MHPAIIEQVVKALQAVSPQTLWKEDTVVLVPPELVNSKTAACMLGVSTRTINDMVRYKRLKSVRLGKRRLFRPVDIKAFVEGLPRG